MDTQIPGQIENGSLPKATAPDVNDLFPEQAKSVDDLFPADIEKQRYRRQTLGTSPVQDLIFGNTEVNPVARVLDSFGQGAKQTWGASDATRLSKESEDYLKVNKQFDAWNESQNGIVKAANESLFRPAAVQMVRELHDAEALYRGVGAVIHGSQAAISQIGEELSGGVIDRSLQKIGLGSPAQLGHDIAGAVEALPTGLRAPTGIPHAAPHPILAEIRDINAEIAKARDLGVIGGGEDGYFGTKPSEVAPPISALQDAARPVEAPIAEVPKVAPKVEAAPEPGLPAPEAAVAEVATPEAPKDVHAVARDIAPDTFKEYDALTARQDTFRRWITELRDVRNEEAAKSAPHVDEINTLQAKIDDPETSPRLRKKYEDRIAPLIEERDAHIAEATKGDTKDMANVRQKMMEVDYQRRDLAPEVTRAYQAARDRMPQEAPPEAAAPVEATPQAALEVAPEVVAKPADSIQAEAAKPEPAPAAQPPKAAVRAAPIAPGHPIAVDVASKLEAAGRPAEEAQAAGVIQAAYWETRAARFEGRKGTAAEMYAKEAPEIKAGKGVEPAPSEPTKPEPKAPEKAPAQQVTAEQRWEALLADRQARRNQLISNGGFNGDKTRNGVDIRGRASQAWEIGNTVDVGFVKNLLIVEKNGDGSFTLLSKPDKAGMSKIYFAKSHEGLSGNPAKIDFLAKTKDLAAKELELNQTQRGKIRIREEGRNTVTLMKDANASTFIHETGHDWLDRMMKDAVDPAAPADLTADSHAVLKWLGVEKAGDIKTRQHEKFARGFETYMMEGRAPSEALATVFEKFKDWLTKIYNTVKALKAPIDADIRGVFDRMLSAKPTKPVIASDLEHPPGFADIHETTAEQTPAPQAAETAIKVRDERDVVAATLPPEDNNARLAETDAGTAASRREAGSQKPASDGNASGPAPGESRAAPESGAVSAGGGEAAPEGNRPPISGGGKTEPPQSAQATFTGPESPLIDKAGNIRLDNLGTAEDVNKAIRDAADQNNGFIDARRGVVTDGQVLELADALGMDEGQLSQRKLGQAFNAEQIMAARKLLIQSATNVRDAMVRAAEGSEADILAYAEAKTRHQLIQEHVSGITAEAGRALRAFRKLEGQQEAGAIDAFLKDATGKTLFQLQREAQLGSKLTTPAEVSRFVNLSSKPTWSQKIMEAWITALLSGPKTHVANIMGNTISGLARPVETAIAATIGKARSIVTGSQDRVMFGEAKAELFGLVQGSREGIIAGYKAFKTEEPQTTSTRQTEKAHPKAMGSWTVNAFGREMEIGGKQARIPLRLLGAEDEFFKAITSRGAINREAYAIASKENLPPEQFNQRVAQLSMNPTEAMIEKAKEVADYQTFQTPLGQTGRAVQNFANSHLLAKFIVPFVRTPLNLLKYAFERTPLGIFAEETRANLSGKNGAVARDTQIARITLGTMVGIATYELASQGLITGGGPGDKKQKAALQENGWQEYSLRVGDMYYSYNRLDPFSIILGLVADAHEINQAGHSAHAEKEHVPAMIFASITQQIMNRASLRGPSDLIKAVTDPERFGNGYIKGMAGTIVPAFLAQTAQTTDPVMRETRSVLDGIKARIPGMSQDLTPRRTVWGEVKMREGGLGPDIASPIPQSAIKNDPVNQALFDLKAFPSKLDRKIRGVELTDQQYDDYQRVAGRMAKTRLNAIVAIPGFSQMPEVTRKELMTSAITTSRETARSLIMMQNPDIIKKANDAKVAKLRGEPAH